MIEVSFEESLAEQLPKFRKAAGKPPRQEIVSATENIFPGWMRRFNESYGSGDKSKYLKALNEFKTTYEQDRNSSVQRSVLCASFVLNNLYTQLWNESKEALMKTQVLEFILFYDAATGVRFAMTRILSAQDEIADEKDDKTSKSDSNVSMGSPAEEYLKRRKKVEIVASADLLREDPSGFLLMDDSVSSIRAKVESGINGDDQVGEYFLAGVDAARDLYESIYKIVAPLYPQGQSK